MCALLKVAVVTDSIACMPPEMVRRYGVTVMPLSFYCGGRRYRDGVDITPSEAYEMFLEDPESFRTSAVSPGEFAETFRSIGGVADSILCITVSSKLSAVYDAALAAADIVREEGHRGAIEVFDSRTCAAAEGMVVLGSARAAAEGVDLPDAGAMARDISGRVGLLAFLDTVRHVFRSGRIPKIASQAGSALNVKPVLTVSSGALRFLGLTRSQRAGVDRVLREMRDEVGSRSVHVAVMHAYAEEAAGHLGDRISREFNCSELWTTEFSPLMGYSCGTGALGVAFYAD